MKEAQRLLVLAALAVLGMHAQGQDAARLIAMGDSLLAADRTLKALDKFNAAVQLAPTATSYAARARAWSAMDRMDRYLMDVDRALKLDSLHVEANYQRAAYALRVEDYHLADRAATRALESMIGAIKTTLKKGGSVSLVGFGTFAVGKRAARSGRNPRTGAQIKIKAAKVPKFRPGKALKDALN